jgi:hypothetical protein
MSQSLTTRRSVSHKIGKDRAEPAEPPICRVHPPRRLLRSRPWPGFPGSALGSPPTGGGRTVTNRRDKRVTPNGRARPTPIRPQRPCRVWQVELLRNFPCNRNFCTAQPNTPAGAWCSLAESAEAHHIFATAKVLRNTVSIVGDSDTAPRYCVPLVF